MRANIAKTYLHKLLPHERITITFLGAANPVSKLGDKAGFAANRRVEIFGY